MLLLLRKALKKSRAISMLDSFMYTTPSPNFYPIISHDSRYYKQGWGRVCIGGKPSVNPSQLASKPVDPRSTLFLKQDVIGFSLVWG